MLRNIWYPAAWSADVAPGTGLPRTILGDEMLIVHFLDGSFAMLRDRCPHKFLPLHLGHVREGSVECAYHGLHFDREGRCVRNPHPPHSCPAALRVDSWPIRESQGMLWVWPGDPERADPASIPHFHCLERDSYRVGTGTIHGVGHYQLLSDNILDLSHIAFLHPNLGSDAVTGARVEVTARGNTITTARFMKEELLPDALARTYGTVGVPVDRTLTVEWRPPCTMLLTVELAPAGSPNERRTISHTVHMGTPESDRSCHYFFAGCRLIETSSDDAMTGFIAALTGAFNEEDKPIIEAQQLCMEQAGAATRPTLLTIDDAAVRARRVLDRLVAAERGSRTETTAEERCT